jgi:hypothetical protein
LPLILLWSGVGAIAALFALGGLFVIEWLWVLAPQHVPLS